MSNSIVVLETNNGEIEIELDGEKAPITVENFLRYVKEGHYDGTIFHRVIDGFMIQCGGYTHEGIERPAHEPIKLESKNGLKNEVGTIAMARTGDPDSATCQFFINVANNRFLDYKPNNDGYAVFGRVVSGMDVVNRIKAVKTGSMGEFTDWPIGDIIIKQAYVKNLEGE